MDEIINERAGEQNERVGADRIRKLNIALSRYHAAKERIEQRAIDAEEWWKLRNEIMRRKTGSGDVSGFEAKSGWLHNVIVAKHADLMEAYPECHFLPREPGDEQEARMLSSVVPVVLEQAGFEDCYSEVMWQKLKTGTGIYKVWWDAERNNGLGDIAIERVDILNLFWEPYIKDIQDSRYIFHTASIEREVLEEQHPELKGKLGGNTFVPRKFRTDGEGDSGDKVTIIDAWYKKQTENGKELHYIQYVGDTILYSSENEGKPIYDHGMYPFVLDCLYPIEYNPSGYGFIDLGANIQEQLDTMQTAFLKNTIVGAVPRYFTRNDGSVNEQEFLDLNRPLVHVDGQLGTDSLRMVDYKSLGGNYINLRQYTIDELKQTTGNTEASNGNTPSGVTAASAIAALQEAAGKGSRDAIRTSYRAYTKVCSIVIELIRQFYDLPRQFRITGQTGDYSFANFSNEGIKLQSTGEVYGQEMYRLPVFDIKVAPEKRTAYSRITQNELALQLFNNGFFNPQLTDQVLCALNMMDFDDKDKVTRMVGRNGGMYQELVQYKQLALALTAKYEPERLDQLAGTISQSGAPVPTAGAERDERAKRMMAEDTRVTRARAQSRGASQID